MIYNMLLILLILIIILSISRKEYFDGCHPYDNVWKTIPPWYYFHPEIYRLNPDKFKYYNYLYPKYTLHPWNKHYIPKFKKL